MSHPREITVSDDERKIKVKEWIKNNPEKRKAAVKKYHETHAIQEREYRINNRERINSYAREYRRKNKDRLNYKLREKRKDPIVKLRHKVSCLVRFYIDGNKTGSIMEHLPFTIQELKQHIENKFEEWMSWNNWGKYNPETWNDEDQSTWTWQIDHIIPQSKLPYTSMEDDNFKKCWSLSNIRPLSSKINIIDGATKCRHKV